ncbi:NAD(P)/FAD-dependent oxidoreductase [Aquabacterium sp.]|uniref:NAD(P)/FAD-dependent oxidoreductase n=1 Tax=Aquabacterium sp. TaxID=1872578 RepID=UPI0035ADCA1E
MSVLQRLRHAPSYYEATVTRAPPRPALSGLQRTQVGVVGGGIAGVSTALELAERGFKVTLLEAQRVGSVASGRNGGQVLAGLACEISTIEAQLGLDAARRIWALTTDAVQLVRQRLQRYAIEADAQDGTLFVSCTPKGALALQADWRDLAERYGCTSLQWLERDALRPRIGSERYHGGWRDPDGLHLHPLKYVLGLAAAAERLGVTIHEGSRVLRIDPAQGGQGPVLHTDGGQLQCDQVVLAGGAPLGETIAPFNRLTMPYDSWIIATEPLPIELADAVIPGREAVADDSYDIDYYRLTPDRRMLFGSGANYLARNEDAARAFLQRRMMAVFPQLAGVRVEHLWGGVMEVPLNRAPVMGPWRGDAGTRVWQAQGFGGHGVAFTGMAGRIVAEHLAGEHERFELLAGIRHRAFPFGRGLQVPMMMAGIYWYRLREHWATR